MSYSIRIVAVAALGIVAHAQVELSWTGGILGQQVTYHTSTASPAFYALLPSTTVGPTPLAIVDPTDSRSLDVGLDLFALMYIGFSPGALGQDKSYRLPLDPALSGLPLYAQSVSLLGATLFVDISERVSFKLGAVGDTDTTIGALSVPRRGHSATALLDGRVLIAGGVAPTGPLALHDSLELYDSQTQTFSRSSAVMGGGGRTRHTATLLADGRVLLLGGYGAGGAVLAGGVIYDPNTDGLTPIASSGAPRILHTAVPLADGRVFVAGGSGAFTLGHPIGYPAAFASPVTNKTALYDPVANAWTAGPNLPKALTLHAAGLLASGKVLIAAGVEVPNVGLPTTTSAAYLYDPAAQTLTATQNMPFALAAGHTPSPMPGTPGPKMPIIGGMSIDFAGVSATLTNTTSVYDLNTQAWSAGPALPGIRSCMDIECTGSIYLGAGGMTSLVLATGAGTPGTTIVKLDLAAGTWTTVGATTTAREGVDGAIVDGGKRLLITGAGPGSGGPDLTADSHIVGP
jgi:hypothetical protein